MINYGKRMTINSGDRINNGMIKDSRTGSGRAAFLQYTILFCILAAGIYGVLFINHKTFIQSGDAVKQGYFWTVELKHQMEKLLAGEGLQLWSWSRLLGMSIQTNRYWDLFSWLAAAFPAGYTELGYTIAVLLRIYCGGAVFLALMRYTGRGVFASVFGAAVYSFSGYTIITGLVHADFIMNIYLFPLLVLTVEMIYKDRSPAFFSLATGLYLVSNFYYSYMAAISVILYIFLRYFAYREFDLKGFAKNTGRFALYGIIGLLIGCIQFIPDFAALSAASTDSATDSTGVLFDTSYYTHIGKIIVGTGNITNPEIIGWTVIAIMLLASAMCGLRLKKTPAMMTLILFVGTMIPAVCSIYNCFGYPALRWVFALELFAAWAAAEEIDSERLLSIKNTGAAAAALVITAFLTLGVNYLFGFGMGRRAVIFMAVQIMGGMAFAVLLILSRTKGCTELPGPGKAMILLILIGTMTACWSASLMDSKEAFYKNNEINQMLEKSTQRAGALIGDDGFYRVDQVDSILYRHRVKLPPNETLWWQTRSIYGYNSRVPSDLLEFDRLAGNNYGYSKRVAVVSNDNRTGLDYLYGVKYFLGDDPKNGKSGSDEYAGYGFEEYKDIDGVRVFKSKYDVSAGYVFDKYMSVSEFEKLSYAEREQALLQAIVLPDDKELTGIRRVSAADIKTAVKDVSYSVAETDGVKLKDGVIKVKEAGGSITLEPEAVKDSQLLLTITGLRRNAGEGQSKSFELHVTNEYVEEIADNILTNQSIPDIEDYNLNLGYYKDYSSGKIKITFYKTGKYTYDDIKLSAMDAGLFDECIDELSSRRLRIDRFSDTLMEGTVDTESGGIVFLSIIEPERWECYIDGEKTETIKNTDIAFTGTEIPAGHHNVTLRYRNSMARKGALLSVAGLIILTIACLIRRRSLRNYAYR